MSADARRKSATFASRDGLDGEGNARGHEREELRLRSPSENGVGQEMQGDDGDDEEEEESANVDAGDGRAGRIRTRTRSRLHIRTRADSDDDADFGDEGGLEREAEDEDEEEEREGKVGSSQAAPGRNSKDVTKRRRKSWQRRRRSMETISGGTTGRASASDERRMLERDPSPVVARDFAVTPSGASTPGLGASPSSSAGAGAGARGAAHPRFPHAHLSLRKGVTFRNQFLHGSQGTRGHVPMSRHAAPSFGSVGRLMDRATSLGGLSLMSTDTAGTGTGTNTDTDASVLGDGEEDAEDEVATTGRYRLHFPRLNVRRRDQQREGADYEDLETIRLYRKAPILSGVMAPFTIMLEVRVSCCLPLAER